MTKEEFKELVQRIVDTYGVYSYLNNIEEDMTEDEINDDLWFNCPECEEPIFYDDYDMSEYNDDFSFQCPICEEEFEL